MAIAVADQGVFALRQFDLPAEVRTRAIQAMIDNYFRPGTIIQASYPTEMRNLRRSRRVLLDRLRGKQPPLPLSRARKPRGPRR